MQGVISSVAGQATGSLLVGSAPVATTHGNVTSCFSVVSRKPFGAKLYLRRTDANNSVGSRHLLPHGKRLGRFCLRVSALQQASEKSIKWVLDPVGDGDTSHLDKPVPLPNGFQLVSDAATVGRVEGRVDIVIPVATVSGVHARLERRDGQLYVIDLDSTNGTYVDDKRVRPGAVTPVFPGSFITFGDEHLAVFRFSQIEEVPEEPQEQEAQSDPVQ